MNGSKGARQRLLDALRARGAYDARVLAAMAQVDRAAFVAPEVRPQAWADVALPIGEAQVLDRPSVVAHVLSAMALAPGERVLEVGAGSGYVLALLQALGCAAYGLEVRERLAAQARRNLAAAGAEGAQLEVGDAARGWQDAAPFAGIVVSCAAPRVPDALLDQLADGGCLVMPVGDAEGHQQLERWRRRKDALRQETLGQVRFVPWTDARTLAKLQAPR